MDRAGTHQTPLARAWILEGESKARGLRQSGKCDSTAMSLRGVEADAPKCRLVRGSALLPWLVV